MTEPISDSESDCYEEATIVKDTHNIRVIHLNPPSVIPNLDTVIKQSSIRSPAPQNAPPSPPTDREKEFVDKLLMNLGIRSGYDVVIDITLH